MGIAIGNVTDAGALKPTAPGAVTLESWAQGYMVGSLIIMAGVTVANMRKNVLLHKLILIELILGMPHGTFMFPNPPAYGWYLSVTAIFLNISWSLHNVVAWMKNKPFLTRRVSLIYIGTVILAQPYWVLEIYANFAYFNNINRLFTYTRPYEAIFRDPWWIFTTVNLFWNIKKRYEFNFLEIIRVSPRFGILLLSMMLSISFIILDCLSVTSVISDKLPDGLNPFWKLAFVFKCFTDTIILDDFKTALDKLQAHRMGRISGTTGVPGTAGSGTAIPPPIGGVGAGGSKAEDGDVDPLALAGSASPEARRPTEYEPWNESRGVTGDERFADPAVEDVDLESQLKYWERADGSTSTATR